MTPLESEIKRLRELCENATEGRWFTDELCYVFNNPNCDIMVLQARGTGAGLSDEQQANNLRLAAESQTALPKLLDALELALRGLSQCHPDYYYFSEKLCREISHDTVNEIEQILTGGEG